MDVDELLKPAPKSSEELRARAVQDIAQARYDLPTPDLPSYRAFVNVPGVTMAVKDEAGNELAPDIVVVETPGNVLRMLARVETAETVTEEEAECIWGPLGKLPDVAFYLYVPVGQGGKAKRICKVLGVDVYGFRTWRYIPQGIEINEISEPPGIITALMPPLIRKIMRGT
jgi:hypothetical protein